MILAWCNYLDGAIVTFEDKNDFDSCSNSKIPHDFGVGSTNLDLFIAIQNTEKTMGSIYFASAASCVNGFKLEIEIETCSL